MWACSGVWGRHTANWHSQHKQHFSTIEVAIMQSLQSLPLVIYHVYTCIYNAISYNSTLLYVCLLHTPFLTCVGPSSQYKVHVLALSAYKFTGCTYKFSHIHIYVYMCTFKKLYPHKTVLYAVLSGEIILLIHSHFPGSCGVLYRLISLFRH